MHPLYAGFWRRAGGSFVDGAILMVPAILLSITGVADAYPWWETAGWTVVGWLYYASFHSSPWQATPGKRAFGIKITDLQGRRIGFGRATGRHLASLLSTLVIFMGYLLAAATPRKQTLHDMLAGTLAVNEKVASGDVPRGSGVMPLTGKTIGAIASWFALVLSGAIATVYLADPYKAELKAAEVAPAESEAAAGRKEELSYAIYAYPFFGGEAKLVREGTLTYRHSDVRTLMHPGADGTMSVKVLEVADGYQIHGNIFREERLDGFGLSLSKEGHGFSWDWFDRSSGDIFRKLQGGGQLQVRTRTVGDKVELAEVLFLDDVTLRLDRYWIIPFRNRNSDEMVVKRGSVLWFAD